MPVANLFDASPFSEAARVSVPYCALCLSHFLYCTLSRCLHLSPPFVFFPSLSLLFSYSVSGSLSLSLYHLIFCCFAPPPQLFISTSLLLSPLVRYYSILYCTFRLGKSRQFEMVGWKEEAEEERKGDEYRGKEVREKQGRIVAHSQQ